MIKFIFIICIIFFANAKIFQEQPPPVRQCDATYYGNRGEACDNNLKRCKWFYTCRNNVCTYGNIGAECSAKEHCFGWKEENLRCVNNKCVKPKYPGFECSDSQECWTGTCTNGLCSGKPEGEACNPNNLSECDNGLYCSLRTSRCVKQLRSLDTCNDYVYQDDIPQGANYNVICPGGHVCMGRYNGTQVCRPYRNGPLGSSCNWNRDGNEACEFGLVCSQTRGVCEVPNTQYPTFGCQGSPRNCSFAAGETCICDEGTSVGTCKTRTDRVKCDLNAAMNEYRKCMTVNNCPYEKNYLFSFLIDTIDKKTCLGYYCGEIARKYLCCALPAYRRIKWSQASSGVLNCDAAPSNGGAVAIAFLIIFLLCCGAASLVAIGVGLYFFIKNRQSKYQSFE